MGHRLSTRTCSRLYPPPAHREVRTVAISRRYLILVLMLFSYRAAGFGNKEALIKLAMAFMYNQGGG